MRPFERRIAGVIIMLSIFTTLFAGCTGEAKVTVPDPVVKEVPPAPGELVGVIHESSGGTMNWRSEFAIEVSPDEIVHCEYWPEPKEGEPVDYDASISTRDREAISGEQWADIKKAALDLWGVWEEVPEGTKSVDTSSFPDIEILDGGDYSRWYLIWKTEDGQTEKRQYYNNSDRRIRTLTDLLHELADPQGREIVWYEPPVLCGATYINSKTHCSFQCNWWGSTADEGYRFITRFTEDGEEVDVYDQTDSAVWEKAFDAFCRIDPDKFEYGSYTDDISLSLYYSDYSQKSLKLNKQTAAWLEPMLREIALDYVHSK